MNNKFTRGNGLLEGFLAQKRTKIANKLLKNVSKRRILDIGCGSYPYFLTTTGFKEKYGIDPSLTSSKIKDINLKKFDVTKQKLPFKDNNFAAVVMLAVFEHLDKNKLPLVLKEIRRVLNKNGVFIITTPSPWADKPLHYLANFGIISKEEIHEHKHNLNHKTISQYLINAGFSKSKLKKGYFEFYLNMWFTVIK
jgi:ubiquinone/menaquinone biosynthesis C-methylase UbiE